MSAWDKRKYFLKAPLQASLHTEHHQSHTLPETDYLSPTPFLTHSSITWYMKGVSLRQEHKLSLPVSASWVSGLYTYINRDQPPSHFSFKVIERIKHPLLWSSSDQCYELLIWITMNFFYLEISPFACHAFHYTWLNVSPFKQPFFFF